MTSSTLTYAWNRLDASLKQRLTADGRKLCRSIQADGTTNGAGAVEQLLDSLLTQYMGEERSYAAWHFVSEVLSMHRTENDGVVTYARLVSGLSYLDASISRAILAAVCQDAVTSYREALVKDCSASFLAFVPELPPGARFNDLLEPMVSEMLEEYRAANMHRAYGALLSECWHAMPPTARRNTAIVNAFCAAFDLPVLGTIIAGKYRLEDLVGLGGMGVVYRAHHEHLLNSVAIKMMRPDCTNVALFIQEGRTTVQIDDDRFVTVRDAGLSVDTPPLHYVMSYVEGGRSLADLLQTPAVFDSSELRGLACALKLPASSPLDRLDSPAQNSTLSSSRIWKWVIDRSYRRARERACAAIVERTAVALHELHELGYIHCDLKPGNVLVCARCGPMIADLGLCRQLEHGLAKGQRFVGTPAYASPEQLADADMSPKSDVYQLGAILYRCLTGYAPPIAKPQDEIPATDRATEIRRSLQAFDQNIAAVCSKAMAHDANDRYESAIALAEDLERFVQRRPTQARGYYRLRTAVRSAAHFWGTWLALALLVISAIAGWSFWSRAADVPGCVASENRYRLRETVPPPDVELVTGSQWPTPSYEPYIMLRSSLYFDLSAWKPLPANQDPQRAGRIEEARYTRVVDLMRKHGASNGHIEFQFRTEGYDIDLRCTTHSYQVKGSADTELLGGGTQPVKVRQIIVDISDEPLETPIRVVLQGSLWNGFQAKSKRKQWIGTLASVGLSRVELAMRLPAAKPVEHLPRLFVFKHGSPELQVPADTQNFYAAEDGCAFVWRPTDIRGNTVYKMEWDWNHDTH